MLQTWRSLHIICYIGSFSKCLICRSTRNPFLPPFAAACLLQSALVPVAVAASVKPKHIYDTFVIMEQTTGLIEKQEKGSPKERYLQQRRAQMFLSNMISVRILSGEEKKAAYRKLEQYQPVCQDYLCGTIGNCAKVSLRLFGVPVTCALLEIARRLVK